MFNVKTNDMLLKCSLKSVLMLQVLTASHILTAPGWREFIANGQLCFSSTINTGGFSKSLNSNIYVLLQQGDQQVRWINPSRVEFKWLGEGKKTPEKLSLCQQSAQNVYFSVLNGRTWGCSLTATLCFSGFTAAAQYGLYLTVTHKPFRAATASPELHSWSTPLSSSVSFSYSSSSTLAWRTWW